MARQAILTRETPAAPMLWFLIDEAALRRQTGSAADHGRAARTPAHSGRVAERHYSGVPNVAHAELTGGFAIAEAVNGSAAYIETALTGQVFEDPKVVLELSARFDALRTEALRGTESLCLIEEGAREWRQQATGGRPATQVRTVASA